MAKNPWHRPKKPSTKPDAVGAAVGAASAATDIEVAPEGAPTGLTAGKARRPSPRKIAIDILARREHSVAELRDKLNLRAEGNDWSADDIESAITALLDNDLLSEDRFVTTFVGSYTRRGHGPVWIRAELERRGISGQAIAEALAAADTDWPAAAAEVRRKRFGGEPPADFKERAKQARFLQYRGFTAEQAIGACGDLDQ